MLQALPVIHEHLQAEVRKAESVKIPMFEPDYKPMTQMLAERNELRLRYDDRPLRELLERYPALAGHLPARAVTCAGAIIPARFPPCQPRPPVPRSLGSSL